MTNAPAIPLHQTLANVHHWFAQSMLKSMRMLGYHEITIPHLTFFSHLDCGATHASDVARRMNISRQAVYKATKSLQTLGYLELVISPDDRRQKIILMTPSGESLAIDARKCFQNVEAKLGEKVGSAAYKALQFLSLDD